MSSGYNELKLEVLEEFENWDEITASDMAKTLGRTHPSIAMALLRYHRHGLLSRYTIHRNEKVYSLTARGLERLDWLMEQDFKDSDDDDEHAHDGDEDGLKDYDSLLELEREIRELEEVLRI